MRKLFTASFIAVFVLSGMANTHALVPDAKNVYNAEVYTRLQPTPESMAQRETQWMTTELELTADQVTKVDAINVKYAQQQMGMFQGGRGDDVDMDARQKQMTEINAQKRKEFESVLSAGQLIKYDEYLANRPAGGRGGFGGPPPNQQ